MSILGIAAVILAGLIALMWLLRRAATRPKVHDSADWVDTEADVATRQRLRRRRRQRQ